MFIPETNDIVNCICIVSMLLYGGLYYAFVFHKIANDVLSNYAYVGEGLSVRYT